MMLRVRNGNYDREGWERESGKGIRIGSNSHPLLAYANPLPAKQRKKSDREVKEVGGISMLADGVDEEWRS